MLKSQPTPFRHLYLESHLGHPVEGMRALARPRSQPKLDFQSGALGTSQLLNRVHAAFRLD